MFKIVYTYGVEKADGSGNNIFRSETCFYKHYETLQQGIAFMLKHPEDMRQEITGENQINIPQIEDEDYRPFYSSQAYCGYGGEICRELVFKDGFWIWFCLRECGKKKVRPTKTKIKIDSIHPDGVGVKNCTSVRTGRAS